MNEINIETESLRDYCRRARSSSVFVNPPGAIREMLDKMEPLLDEIDALRSELEREKAHVDSLCRDLIDVQREKLALTTKEN